MPPPLRWVSLCTKNSQSNRPQPSRRNPMQIRNLPPISGGSDPVAVPAPIVVPAGGTPPVVTPAVTPVVTPSTSFDWVTLDPSLKTDKSLQKFSGKTERERLGNLGRA